MAVKLEAGRNSEINKSSGLFVGDRLAAGGLFTDDPKDWSVIG